MLVLTQNASGAGWFHCEVVAPTAGRFSTLLLHLAIRVIPVLLPALVPIPAAAVCPLGAGNAYSRARAMTQAVAR